LEGAGLYAILKAMEIGRGDEVILPGYTCVMDVNPVKYLRAKPIHYEELFIIMYILFSLINKHS